MHMHMDMDMDMHMHVNMLNTCWAHGMHMCMHMCMSMGMWTCSMAAEHSGSLIQPSATIEAEGHDTAQQDGDGRLYGHRKPIGTWRWRKSCRHRTGRSACRAFSKLGSQLVGRGGHRDSRA